MTIQDVMKELERRSRNIIDRDPVEIETRNQVGSYVKYFPSPYSRLLKRMNPQSSFDVCWPAISGLKDKSRCPQFKIKDGGLHFMKHLVYEEFVGDIPDFKSFIQGGVNDGIVMTCGNNKCVNPDHMELQARDDFHHRGVRDSNPINNEFVVRAVLTLFAAGWMQKDIKQALGIGKEIIRDIIHGNV